MPSPPPARRPPPPAVGSVDPGLSLRHPALLLTAVAAAIGILLSVSFKISDPDIFQHLRVGRAIWESHSVPAQYLWTWPAYGTAEVLPSWLFRALLWPFWAVGGIRGLYAWRRPVRAAAGAGRPPRTGRLGVVLLASAAVSFLNPFGWRALWQPFDFFLHLRHEALYQSVGELMPIDWDNNRVNGLLALMIG